MTESEREVAQSCLTLCNPIDCSLPGSSVHGPNHLMILHTSEEIEREDRKDSKEGTEEEN